MSESLIAPTFLFRFSADCRYCDPVWSDPGEPLSSSHTLPCFAEIEGRPTDAKLRAGWSHDGLTFALVVSNKEQTPWCRETKPEDSDGLHVWIDTRDTHNIHRATRFCHRFAFLPTGGGRRNESPVAKLVPINRARENPKPFAESAFAVRSRSTPDGYELLAHVPASALTGFDPTEHPRLGFFYAVADRELGWQTFSIGLEFPFAEDPSLWGTLRLVE